MGEGALSACGPRLPSVSQGTAGIQQTGAGGYSLNPLCVRLFRVTFSSHLPGPVVCPRGLHHMASDAPFQG